MKKYLILMLFVSSFFSCSNDDGTRSSEIRIRLSNVSAFTFQNIVVNTTTGNVGFENLNPGQTTNFKTFETAYRYAFVELEIEGKTYTLQPIDYVGETPLENGNYTYQIDANNSQEQYGKLSLTLVEE